MDERHGTIINKAHANCIIIQFSISKGGSEKL